MPEDFVRDAAITIGWVIVCGVLAFLDYHNSKEK